MDVYKIEPPRAAALRKTTAPTEENLRPPLVPSEKNNAAFTARKPRTREITSRYKSGIAPATPSLSTPAAPRRCPSPNTGRTMPAPAPSLPKRAQSAERRRPSTPSRSSILSSPPSRPSTPSSPSSRPSTPVRELAAEIQLSSRRLVGGRTPDGLWPSMRSLSSSFQSESISIPISKKDKPVSNANVSSDHTLKSAANVTPERKRTPLRGRNASDQSENSKPMDNSHARVSDQHRWPGIMGGKLSVSAMSRSVDLTDRVSRTAALSISSRRLSPSRRTHVSDGPSRGLQKTTTEVSRRLSLDGSGRLECEISTGGVSSNHSERAPSLSRPNRTHSSPLPGSHRPSSPSKASLQSAMSSRAAASPSRTRSSTPFASSSCATGRAGISSSVLNYMVDVRKGKKNANHIEDVHQLRLLYNRDSQWRFVNARADAALSIQKVMTESNLYSVWATTSELRDSVTMKRINMQQLRQEMQLDLILKDQMRYLEDWALLERDHSSSLSGATEALKASTLRLPVTGGARADMHAVKDAVSSAVDVMQAMGSSICYLMSRVEDTNSLVAELADVAAKERALLDECRELLASTAAMQVQESSLTSHLLQLRQDVHRL